MYYFGILNYGNQWFTKSINNIKVIYCIQKKG